MRLWDVSGRGGAGADAGADGAAAGEGGGARVEGQLKCLKTKQTRVLKVHPRQAVLICRGLEQRVSLLL